METPVDYYALLDLQREATDAQVKQAYRVHALKYHPLKHEGQPSSEGAAKQFRLVAEAYDVLTQPQLRALFDQYGSIGLKTGVPNGRGGRTSAYTFRLNPLELFADNFGNASPFADFFEAAGTAQGAGAELLTTYNKKEVKKAKTQEVNLYVSLEELYSGCSKSMKVLRKRLSLDGRRLVLEEKIFKLDIGAGWKEGTKLTFAGEGDEVAEDDGTVAGDLVFILKIKPHPRFVRKGNDLEFVATLSLKQALVGHTLEIQTLDGRTLTVGISDIATPDGVQLVEGEGMPSTKTPGKKGNLKIRFDIRFPKQLTTEQKNALQKILPA